MWPDRVSNPGRLSHESDCATRPGGKRWYQGAVGNCNVTERWWWRLSFQTANFKATAEGQCINDIGSPAVVNELEKTHLKRAKRAEIFLFVKISLPTPNL